MPSATPCTRATSANGLSSFRSTNDGSDATSFYFDPLTLDATVGQ